MTVRDVQVRDALNDYGTTVSVHVCHACGKEYTVCPPVVSWPGCMDPECDSYDPKCDVDVLFGDFDGFVRHCVRTGRDPDQIGPRGRLGREPKE